MSKNKAYTHVSLFSGAGGLDIGLEQAGFHTVWANDFNHDACETHRLWSNATVVEGDIGKVDYDTIPDCDIASFGFPCQGFSLSGLRKVDDSRNVLYRHCVKLVEKKQPKLFLAENVKGLLTLGGGKIKDAIIADFESKGYVMSINLVNAADYHVPEDRQRILLVGIRKDLAEKYGVEFKVPAPFPDRISIRQALEGLAPAAEDEICKEPYSSRYMSRNRKRGWDSVSFTIPAMAKQVPLWPGSPDMVKVGKDFWQFGEKGSTRRMSYKEAAAMWSNKNKLSASEVAVKSKQKAFFKCRDCGQEFEASIVNVVRSVSNDCTGCYNCKMKKIGAISKPECFVVRLMLAFAGENGIANPFSDVRNILGENSLLGLDFVDHIQKLCGEYNGSAWHGNDVQAAKDRFKFEAARKAGYAMIRVLEPGLEVFDLKYDIVMPEGFYCGGGKYDAEIMEEVGRKVIHLLEEIYGRKASPEIWALNNFKEFEVWYDANKKELEANARKKGPKGKTAAKMAA